MTETYGNFITIKKPTNYKLGAYNNIKFIEIIEIMKQKFFFKKK